MDSWVGKIPWRRDRPPTPVFLGFPSGSDGKESTCHAGDLGLIPVLGRSPGGGHDNPLQYSCLENPHGQRRLEGYSSWGCKESDTTEQLSTAQHVVHFGKCIPLKIKSQYIKIGSLQMFDATWLEHNKTNKYNWIQIIIN